MRDFKQNKISGGRGGSSFGNRGGGKSFGGGRDRGRPEMHRATCSDCGSSCEVPFKPTGNKPVLCSDCFGSGRDGGRDSGRGGDRGRDRGRGRDDRGGRGGGRDFGRDRQMYKAICADCGNKCEVPFKPSGDKPVLCSDCFGGSKGGGGDSSSGTQHTAILAELAELHEQQSELAGKIDKIIAFLQRGTPIKEVTVTKAEVENAVKEVKKEKKTAEKKATAKKAVKKTPTKKKATKKTPAKKKTVKKVIKKTTTKKNKKK